MLAYGLTTCSPKLCVSRERTVSKWLSYLIFYAAINCIWAFFTWAFQTGDIGWIFALLHFPYIQVCLKIHSLSWLMWNFAYAPVYCSSCRLHVFMFGYHQMSLLTHSQLANYTTAHLGCGCSRYPINKVIGWPYATIITTRQWSGSNASNGLMT